METQRIKSDRGISAADIFPGALAARFQQVRLQTEQLAQPLSAEDYHQRYFENNPAQPYCQFVVAPKVAKFRKKFAERVKKS